MDTPTTGLNYEDEERAVVEVLSEMLDVLKEIRDLLSTQNQMEYGTDLGLMP